MYVLASLSGRGVVCSSLRFGCKLGVMDVFGDKDCLISAAYWRYIGNCIPDQTGIDSKKFLDSLAVRKKWWLTLIILFVFPFGALIVLIEGSAIAPFIYALF